MGSSNGIVTLSGTVPFYSDKLAAEAAAKRVQGVKAVAEDIEIRLLKTAFRLNRKQTPPLLKKI
jgi:hypothetical protein